MRRPAETEAQRGLGRRLQLLLAVVGASLLRAAWEPVSLSFRAPTAGRPAATRASPTKPVLPDLDDRGEISFILLFPAIFHLLYVSLVNATLLLPGRLADASLGFKAFS